MTFRGFPKEGLEFLSELGSEDKDWFAAHRDTYDADVADPAREFVTAMTEQLQSRVSATVVGQPKVNGSISPINNDIRFARDAAPYKDHLLFRFWDGPEKRAAPTLFVRLNEHETGFATGSVITSLDQWREAVDSDAGEELADALAVLARRRKLDVAGRELKRVPAPYAADHPRADLLRHKVFQARWSEPTPRSVSKPAFVDWCVRRLEACAPVHQWLVDNLG